MIQQRECVQRTLSMNYFLRVRRTLCTRASDLISLYSQQKMVAASVDPMFLASRTAMKKQERFSRTFCFVIHFHIVESDSFGFHGAVVWSQRRKETSY